MKCKNIYLSLCFAGCAAMDLLILRFRMIARKIISFLVVFFITLFACIFSTNLIAQSSVVTLESQVKGNQEQPNILSIVPWKQADDFGRIDQAIDLSVEDVFQHLDREEFAREYEFYQHHIALKQQKTETQNSD